MSHNSASCDPKLRLGLRPQNIVRALIGVGCLKVSLTLLAGRGSFGVSLAVTAVHWISCAGSLVLLALLDRDVQERCPGISSLFRGYSYGAMAGSLLPCAAGPLLFMDLGNAAAFAVALAGLALTLFSLRLLEWLLTDINLDGPLPIESVVMAQLTALQEVVEHCV